MTNTAQPFVKHKKIPLPQNSPPFFIRVLVTTLLMIILFGISIAISVYSKDQNSANPSNFDECSSIRGSVIQESFPPVCVTKQGRRFVKQLSLDDSKHPADFCGGIAGLPCSDGYICKLDGTYPDAGGTCIKD